MKAILRRLLSTLANPSKSTDSGLPVLARPAGIEAEVEALEPRVLFSAAPVDAPEQEAGDSQTDAAPDGSETIEQGSIGDETGSDQNPAANATATGATPVTLVPTGADLNAEALEAIAEAARQRWIDAGISADQLAALDSVTYQISDLGNNRLGSTTGNLIAIDDDGASRGWFIDLTPTADEEFGAVSPTRLLALADSGADQRMDLLTVILHEQGHILGLPDAGSTGALMSGALSTGNRLLPTNGQAASSEPGSLAGTHFLGATITVGVGITYDHATIQAAVSAAAAGDTILVSDGTYVENVVIDKNLTLLSENGRGATFIQGISGTGALGAIQVTNNTSSVQIGASGQGFTIVGIDGNGSLENAAVYFQGNHSGAQVLDNEIVANGDHGLLTEYGAIVSGFVIDGNTFSGKTFAGAQPGGIGFGTQFDTGNNVPRQLVTIGNGSGNLATANATNITFTNNLITGVAGGISSDNGTSEQGNTLVTIDAATSTISGNTFAGTTNRFATSLRVRRPDTVISGNTFDSSHLGAGTAHLFVQNNTTPVQLIAAANTFDRGVYVDNSTGIGHNLQAAINAVSAGTTIHLTAGTYNGNFTIDKRIVLDGAGSGSNPAVDSILQSASGNSPVITVTGSGLDASNRLTIQDLRVTGATGGENPGAGILVAGSTATGYLTFDNVASVSNQGAGIAFNNTVGITDVAISDATIQNNGNAGIRIASAVPSFVGLSVSDTTVSGNATSGFSYNPSGTLTNVGTDFNFTNVTFTNNSTAGVANAHDVSFFGFHGDASLTNVTVNSGNGSSANSNSHGIVFTNSSAYAAAGTIALDQVTVTGHVGKNALTFQRYNDVSAISLNDVNLAGVSAPWGHLSLDSIAPTPLDLGNTTLSTVAIWATGGVDASAAVPVGAGLSIGAGSGDTTVAGSSGDDVISLGTGADTVIYSGNYADYEVTRADDTITITDLRLNSPDGTDTLTGVDALAFADTTVNLAIVDDLSDPAEVQSVIEALAAANPGEPVVLEGTAGDDTIVIDLSSGNWLPDLLIIDGGSETIGGIDTLVVKTPDGQNVIYTPDTSTFGSGEIVIGGKTIRFVDFEPVDFEFDGVSSSTFTLNLPNGDDVVDVADGTLISDPGKAALVLSGTTGGIAFETAHVRGYASVVIDTTDSVGTDSVTVTSASGSHANTSLTINTGTEAGDTIAVNGAINVGAGSVTLTSATVNLSALITAGTVTGATQTVNVASTASIQDGIDIAASGATVNVAAGTYAESIILNKAVDVRGPNWNVSPNGDIRVTEAVIVPTTTNTSSGAVVTITSSGASFRGFTVDGDNTSLPDSGFGLGGAFGTSIDAARAIFIGANGVTDIDVSKNIAKNAVNGIRLEQTTNYFASGTPAVRSYDITVDDNLVQDITSVGIRLGNSMYAKVTNNTISNVEHGIFFGSFRISDAGSATDRVVENNTISARFAGIWVNLFHASPYVLRGNSISVADPAPSAAPRTAWFGIMYTTVSAPQNFTNQLNLPQVVTPEFWRAEDNDIDGSALESGATSHGYWLYYVDNNRDSLGVDHYGQISGGTVTNVDYGILLKNRDTHPATNFGTAAVGAHAAISDVDISLNAGGTGIRLVDDPGWTSSNPAPLVNKRDVRLTVGADVTISGGTHGVVIANQHAQITGESLGTIAFSGQTGDVVRLEGSAGNISAASATGVATIFADTASSVIVANAENNAIAAGSGNDTITAGAGINSVQGGAGSDTVVYAGNFADYTIAFDGAGSLVVTGASNVDTLSQVEKLTFADKTAWVVGSSVGSEITLIQNAIDAATSGDVVLVAPGTYSENLVLSKQLTLNGAKAGVDARGRIIGSPNPAVETVISPASGVGLNLLGGSNASVIDGFVFVGSVSGATGVVTNDSTNTGLILRNNHISVAPGFNAAALWLASPAVDATIDQNVFVAASGSSQAVFLDTDGFHGLQFINNHVLRDGGISGTGFFVDGNRNIGTSASLQTPLIQGNLFQGHSLGFNAGRFAFDDASIVENTFDGNTGGFAGGTKDSLIARNTFTNNSRYGLRLTGFGGTGDASRGAQNTTVSNNVFSNNGTTIDLVLGYGDLLIEDQFNGTQATNTITQNTFGSSIGAFVHETNVETFNLSNNWWGTASATAIQAKILGAGTGNVDFTSYLDSGTDTNVVTSGFQGDFSTLHATGLGSQSGVQGRIEEGSATVDANGTLILTGGTVSVAGLVAGTATTPNLEIGATATLEVSIESTTPGEFDQLQVTGSVTIEPGATLSVAPTGSPVINDNDVFLIIANDGVDAVSGTFAGLTEGAVVSTDFLGTGKTAWITYAGGDGNDVEIHVGGPITVDATPGDDDIVLRLNATTGWLEVVVNGIITETRPTAGVGLITVNGTDGNDILTLDFSEGSPIPANLVFNGGNPNAGPGDALRILGTGTESMVYNPSNTTFGNGALTIDGQTVTFTGLEPIDAVGLGSVSLVLPNADDVVTIENGSTILGGLDALRIHGTSGGVSFEELRVRNTTTIIINTTGNDGADAITVASASNGHGNTNLQIITGEGLTDNVTIGGAATFAGDVLIQTRDADINAVLTATNLTLRPQVASSVRIGAAGAANMVVSDTQLTANLALSGKLTVGRADGTGTVTISTLNTVGEGYDLEVLSAGQINLTNSLQTDGQITLSANQDNSGADDFDMTTVSSAISTTNATAGAVTIAVGTTSAASTTTLRDITVGAGGGITVTTLGTSMIDLAAGTLSATGTGTVTLNSAANLDVDGNILAGSVDIDAGGNVGNIDGSITASTGVSITANGSVTINGTIDGGSGLIDIDANANGAGAESLTVDTAASLQTTNATLNAISLVAGTGSDLSLAGSFVTGDGGRLTVTAGDDITIGVGSVNVGATGSAILTAQDAVSTAAASTFTIIAADELEINVNNDGLGAETLTMASTSAIAAGATGAALIDINIANSSGAATIGNITTGADGDIDISSTGSGTLSVIAGTTLSAPGTGQIKIDAAGEIVVSGTVDAGSGLIDIDANNDDDGSVQRFAMGADGKLTTLSTAANSVDIRVGNSSGSMTIREIATSGGVSLDMNGSGGLVTNNATTSGIGIVADGDVVLNSENSMSLSGDIDAGAGTITILANTDGAGNESLSIINGTDISTDSTSASAIVVRANVSGGGTSDEGDIVIATVGGSFTTGNGGQVTISTVSGSAANGANLTIGSNVSGDSVTFNVGTNGLVLIESEDTLSIDRGTTLNVVGGGRLILNANTDNLGANSFNMIASTLFGDATIVSDSAHADAITITVGTTTGVSNLVDISLTNGGGLSVSQTGGEVIVDTLGLVDAIGAGDVSISSTGSVTINGTVDAGAGLIDINANTDNDGGTDDFDMGVDGKLATTSTAANSVSIFMGDTTGVQTIREITTLGGVIIDSDGDASSILFTNAALSGVGVVATGAGNVTVDSEGGITVSGSINAGSGLIDFFANSDETGTQSLSITNAAALTTSNSTDSAIRVRVNIPGSGVLDEGDVLINTVGGSFTTGNGGRVTISTISGSAEADPANLTFGDGTADRSVTFNVGTDGEVVIESEDSVTIQRGTTLNIVGGGRLFIDANSDDLGAGIFDMQASPTFGDATIISDSAHADAITITVGSTTGTSNLADISLTSGGGLSVTQTGGEIFVETRGVVTATGGGSIDINGSGSVTINGTLDAGSGLIVIDANSDGDGSTDDFDMGADGKLTTTSTAGNSVSITVGNSSGGSTVRELTTSGGVVIDGNGDTHSITFVNATTSGIGLVATGPGQVTINNQGSILLNGTIDAGSGTIDIDANSDGTGSQSITLAATADLTTTNGSANAIHIQVNDPAVGTGTGDISLAGSLTDGAGGTITLSTRSLDGGNAANITIDNTSISAGLGGSIVIDSNDSVTISASQTVTVTGGSSLSIFANRDGLSTQAFTMSATSAISSDSTTASAVSIEVNQPGSGTAASTIGNVTVGSGGGISIVNHGNSVSTLATTTLTATNGTIDLRGTNLSLSGSASAVGGAVTIARSTLGTIGVFGATAFGDMQISQAELDRITAGTLNIGDPTAGDSLTTLVRVNAVTTVAGVSGLTRINSLNGAGASVQFLGANAFNTVEANANDLIDVQGTASITTQTGGATFSADADGSGAGSFQTAAGSSINTATPGALISVTAADAALNATSSLNAGNGNILLRPSTNASTIGLGGGSGAFNLSDAELATLASNGTVTIGRAGTGSGAVDIDAVDLGTGNYHLAVHGGPIAVEGLDLDDKNVSLTASTGSITDGGGTIDITADAVTLIAQSGSIGAGGAGALDLQATSLSTDTSTSGGSQYFNDVDTVAVANVLAGAGIFEINGGEFDLASNVVSDATAIVVESTATLDVNGAAETVASVTVKNGGTLKGTGSLIAPVTVEAGGTLTPGQSPGIVATGNLVIDGDYAVEVDGNAGAGAVNGHDRTDVTGSVTLNATTSTLTVDITDLTGGELVGGTELVIISNDGADPVTGEFSNFAESAFVGMDVDGTMDLIMTYHGGDGNDVALKVGNLTTRVFVDGSGNLVIEDIHDATNDQLTVEVVGANLVITEADGAILIDAEGALDGITGDLTNQVTVALASFTGNVILRTGDGDDAVIFENMDLTGTRGIVVEDGAGTDTVTFQTASSELADGSVTVHADTITVNAAIDTNGNPIALTADNDVAIQAALITDGGSVTIAADDDIDLSATGSIASSGGNVTLTADADGSLAGDVTLAAGSSIAAVGGTIDIDGASASVTGLSNQNLITIDATNGGITIDGATSTSGIVATATGTLSVLGAGIDLTGGAGDAILTSTGADVSIAGSGIATANGGGTTLIAATDVTISGSGIDATNGTGGGTIDATATAGTITVGGSGLTTDGAGTIGLDAGNDVAINAAVTTGGGAITVNADEDLTISAAGSVSSSGGLITLAADADGDANGSGGALTMTNGSTVDAGNANVDLSADEAITISAITTTGHVTADSTSGAILDGGDAAVEVTASSFAATAATGVGTVGNALELAVSNFEADGGTGGIFIGNTGALTIGGTPGALTGLDTNNGAVVVSATGNLTVSEGVTTGSGSITLVADTLALNASLTSLGDLVIAPFNATTSIGVGGGAGTLNLDDAELGQLSDGFNSITIGDAAAGTGVVDIDSSVFTDDVTIVGGSVSVTELDAGTDSATVTARTGAITDGGDSGSDVIAATVFLNAAGTIGASGDSILLETDTVHTNSNLGGANGNQFLTETDAVDIGSFNAGTGTIEISGVSEFNLVTNNAVADATSIVIDDDTILDVDATDTFAGVTVRSGGTLEGDGSLQTTPVTVLAGGQITPGEGGPENLGVGNLTLNTTSVFAVDIDSPVAGTGYDQLLVTGTVNLGNATLQLAELGYAPTAGQVLTIIVNDGGDAVTGTFVGLLQNTYVSTPLAGLPDQLFQISYTGGTGNDVTLTATGQTATTNISIDGSGNLVIDDILGSATNDTITVSRVGANYVIEDTSGNVLGTLIVGATQTTLSRVQVPVSLVTGGIIVNGEDGNDTVTLTSLGALASGGQLTVDGGDGEDRLFVNGSTTLSGAAAATLTAEGIKFEVNSSLATASGDITATAENGTGNLAGIWINGATLSSTTGSISLTGEGGDTGNYNDGLRIIADKATGVGNTLTAGGAITLTGTAGAGGNADGIEMTKTTVTAGGGITLEGTGGDGGSIGRGVSLFDSDLSAINDSSMSITGNGGATGSSNYGIVLYSGSTLSVAGTGNLTLTGNGGGTVGLGVGIDFGLNSSATVAHGNMSLTGIGGSGTGTQNRGIMIHDGASLTATGIGNISLDGTGNGTGANNGGVALEGSTITTNS
ncbi:MAG: right-handed parallel beta-helix repeat-containing protein, partial [Verrucomicrobiales bacterium]|nr:right-handed parallel beta-helix repeat-containing protein [Verrucomicrobiales bacterium]